MCLRIPTDRRRNKSAIYKCGQGFELGTALNRAGLELKASRLQVHGSNHLATLPPHDDDNNIDDDDVLLLLLLP